MGDKSHSDHSSCGCSSHSSSVSQSLSEMQFERGLWQPAVDGDENLLFRRLQKGQNPNDIDSSGFTPLLYAARNGHLGCCRLLIQFGADLNIRTRGGGKTALHRAVETGRLDVVKLLMASGADSTLTDSDGKTPLERAKDLQLAIVAEELERS